MFKGSEPQEVYKMTDEQIQKIVDEFEEKLKKQHEKLQTQPYESQKAIDVRNTLFYVLQGGGKISLELLKRSNWDIFKDYSEFGKLKPELAYIPPVYVPPFLPLIKPVLEISENELTEKMPNPPKKPIIQPPVRKPIEPILPSFKPDYISIGNNQVFFMSSEPKSSDLVYKPVLKLSDIILFWKALGKIKEAKHLFKKHHQAYIKELQRIEKEHQDNYKDYEDRIKKYYEYTKNREDIFIEQEKQYNQKLIEYQITCEEIRKRNEQKLKDIAEQQFRQEQELYEKKVDKERELYETKIGKERERYDQDLANWESEQENFYKNREKHNKSIEILKQCYVQHVPKVILAYCNEVLRRSTYPNNFPRSYELDFNCETKALIVDYLLPLIKHVPKVKEVKYIKTKDENVDVLFSESELNQIYDNLLYQITLRTIHELYTADFAETINYVIFNGWVKFINKGTGNEESACILSISATRKEFLSINLANVDVKQCFKTLKGIGSSKLYDLTPIAPLSTISSEDRRFVSSYDVAHTLDSDHNLAAMNWEDFEHLIRELFEKEFSNVGAEVKVTQASRDGGVDAVIFDPDPIRGGKIVIQAKRYTNVVGVSAVRDLYGTIMNEGATKGILVTTAQFGADSYEFAKGKPITLLNGSNLLHLLGKHGYRAKINLKEAKKILAEQEQKLH